MALSPQLRAVRFGEKVREGGAVARQRRRLEGEQLVTMRIRWMHAACGSGAGRAQKAMIVPMISVLTSEAELCTSSYSFCRAPNVHDKEVDAVRCSC